jgi:predicted heme/steroid binding protein
MMPNPMELVSSSSQPSDLPQVEQLGTISLETLNQYHCNNPERRCLSLFGTVYDVTSALNSYGPDGAYKEYAGHDMTLALGSHVTGDQWLDKFVKMNDKVTRGARQWEGYYMMKYPVCGRLDKWDENTEDWHELTEAEAEALQKGCTIV